LSLRLLGAEGLLEEPVLLDRVDVAGRRRRIPQERASGLGFEVLAGGDDGFAVDVSHA
jgi:hypothetical protein